MCEYLGHFLQDLREKWPRVTLDNVSDCVQNAKISAERNAHKFTDDDTNSFTLALQCQR